MSRTMTERPNLAAYVARTVAQAPPLTPSQLSRLGALMRGGSK